jgi:hypothetical protein
MNLARRIEVLQSVQTRVSHYVSGAEPQTFMACLKSM